MIHSTYWIRVGFFWLLLALPLGSVATAKFHPKPPPTQSLPAAQSQATLEDWAIQRLRSEALQKAAPQRRLQVNCTIDAEKSEILVRILSNGDPRARQELGITALKGVSWQSFVCQYRDASNKVFGEPDTSVGSPSGTGKSPPALPDVVLAAHDASVQLALQAVHACGRCSDLILLKAVAAGSAVSAKMYPEALRLLFDLLDSRRDLRDVYETVQTTYSASQRGKGEVSLGAPR